MIRRMILALCVSCTWAGTLAAFLGSVERVSPIKMTGTWEDDTNFSGAVLLPNGRLIVGSDELGILQVGRRVDDGTFERTGSIRLEPKVEGDEVEIDVEAVAHDGRFVYAIGSHSRTRTRGDRHNDAYKKNVEERQKIRERPERDRLYRFTVNDAGEMTGTPSVVNLRETIDAHADLKSFGALASKENGVDIEGLAVHGEFLYAGFRGPVFRHGFAPVLRFTMDAPKAATIRLVTLDGRGIRDLVRVSDGFLVLAGPTGDSDQPHRVYWWNGEDCVPGKGGPGGRLRFLGDVQPPAPEGKAEALVVEAEDAADYRVIMMFDSLANGGPQRYRIAKKPEAPTPSVTLCGRNSG